MISSYLWKEVLEDWRDVIEKKRYIERELEKELCKEMKRKSYVSVILGVRRAGKSSIMQNMARKLENAVYVNFEDERLEGATAKDLTNLHKMTEADYYFFDEVHKVKGWEKFVRRVVDMEKAKVVVSGSNSALLSKEYGTLLTGRKKTFYLTPFTFREAKKATGISFEKYLRTGGFPEVVLGGGKRLALEYSEDIFYRDVLSRHFVGREGKTLYSHLLNNPGIEASPKRLRALTGLSTPTIKKYIDYFEEVFVVFELRRHSYSSMLHWKSPPKIYPVDNGLIKKELNLGILLESAVAQHLYALAKNYLGKELKYVKDTKNKFEVDFKVGNTAIQVTYELHERNIGREIKGLEKIKAKRKIIIAFLGYEYASIPENVEIVRADRFLENPEGIFEN